MKVEPGPEMLDLREGFYYVSAIYYGRHALLLGPFTSHAEAVEHVDEGRRKANEVDPRAWWYAYGTCRSETDRGPGKLNEQ